MDKRAFALSLVALAAFALPAAAAAADKLHLYNWNNYIAPETIKRFEAECKCEVVQTYYSDNEELLAKLAAGAKGYDILVPTGNAVEALIKGGSCAARQAKLRTSERRSRVPEHVVRPGQQVLGALRDVDDDPGLTTRR
jgi:spermidine/putrescine transport system substrate-binding protein